MHAQAKRPLLLSCCLIHANIVHPYAILLLFASHKRVVVWGPLPPQSPWHPWLLPPTPLHLYAIVRCSSYLLTQFKILLCSRTSGEARRTRSINVTSSNELRLENNSVSVWFVSSLHHMSAICLFGSSWCHLSAYFHFHSHPNSPNCVWTSFCMHFLVQ